MPQRGRSPNHQEPGASKKNKSNQRHAMNQQRTRPKSAPVNNSGPKNRQNPESPGQTDEKNSGSRLKKCKQTYIALAKQIESESEQQCWQEKNRQGSNNEKTNCPIRIRRRPHFIYTTQRLHQPRKNANLVLLFTAIQHGLPRLHETITAWTRAKIHPNTKPNEFMESTQKFLIRQTFPLHTPTIPLCWKTPHLRYNLLRPKNIRPFDMDTPTLDNTPNCS